MHYIRNFVAVERRKITICDWFFNVYSYSYDLTHSLQYNMAPCSLPPATSVDQSSTKCQFWQTDVGDDQVVHDSSCAERDVEDASSVMQADLFTDNTAPAASHVAFAVDDTDQFGSKRGSNSGRQESTASVEGNTSLSKILNALHAMQYNAEYLAYTIKLTDCYVNLPL